MTASGGTRRHGGRGASEQSVRPDLSPGPRTNSPPPLHDLHEDDFEALGRDLMGKEPTVGQARLFRVRGVAQYGIDVICTRRYDDGLEVAQLKRYRAFGKTDIRDACDLFFQHIAYWRDRSVRRFVLMVTEPLQGRGQDEQFIAEAKRFAKEGIKFEAWSIHDIMQRLRPWPDIVARAFGHHADYWVENICGRRLVPYFRPRRTRTGPQTAGVSERQFAELIDLAAAAVARRLDEIRAVARRGQVSQAVSMLADLRNPGTTWTRLPGDLQARTLRLQASLLLEQANDLPAAKRLMDEAFAIDRDPALRLQARIVLEEQGPAAALEFIRECGGSDPDLIRLAAVCHLRTGNPQAAFDTLCGVSGAPLDPETRRLRALAAVILGRDEEAVREIEQAAAADPGSWIVTMSHGIVLYFVTLSTIAVGDLAVPWPPPCDWLAVRRDDKSTERMRRAADIFAKLATDGLERVRREDLQGWRLACLANDAERQAVSESYCAELLRSDPTHPAAISWALARAYPKSGKGKVLDIAVTRKALEDILDEGCGSLEHLAGLSTIALVTGRPGRISRLVNKHARLFAFPGGSEHRRGLLADVAARSGQPVDAADDALLDPRRVELLAAVREPDEALAASSLVAIAARCESQDTASGVRLDALLRLAQLRRLPAVAPHSDWLAQSVGTADALRLAANAKASANNAKGAVELLEEAGPAFPGSRLPQDLEVLRAQCHATLGNLPLAISIMESLEGPLAALPIVVRLADLHVRRGDLGAASKTLARSSADPLLPAEQALRFAKLLVHDDPALARTLWNRASVAEVGPEWLPTMFDVARRLGIGSEAKAVVERMVANAASIGEHTEKSPILSLTLEQLTEFLAERRRELEHFGGLLERGEAPLHLLAPKMGLPLPRLYHGDLAIRERDGRNGFLTAVHGGRSVASQLPPQPSDWRLHMDVTAFLMASHIGILDAVERCFRPIRISPNLIPALLMMRDRELDSGLNEDRVSDQILEALSTRKLSPGPRLPETLEPSAAADMILRHAASLGGAVVMWSGEIEARPDEPAASNLVGLLERLVADGLLDEQTSRDARAALGAAGFDQACHVASPSGSPLFFATNTVSAAAEAGLLRPAAEKFLLHADPAWLDHLQANKLARTAAAEAGGWVSDLIRRIGDGIADGTYLLLPVRPPIVGPEEEAGELLTTLLDLFAAAPFPGNAMWVDDRWTNAFSSCGPGALVGICDILAALRQYGRLDTDGFFTKILRLRAADVRFIGAVDGEVEYWLGRAVARDGHLEETPALATIRRYVGSCLADERLLQIRPVEQDAAIQSNEVQFIVSWQRAVSQAVLAIWSDESIADGQILARSRWVRDNLSVECYKRLPVMQPNEDGRRVIIAGVHFSLLCGWVSLFLRTEREDRRRCDHYMGWLEAEILGPRLAAEPDLAREIERQIKTFMLAPQPAGTDEQDQFRRTLLTAFLAALPSPIREHLIEDPAITAHLRLGDPKVVVFGKFTVPARDYLRAVIVALGGSAAIVVAKPSQELSVSAELSSGRVRVTVVGPKFKAFIDDALDVLLQADAGVSRHALTADREWIDRVPAVVDAEISRLLAIDSPVERCLAASNVRAKSAAAFYARVMSELHDGRSFGFEELAPPSAEAMLSHLRLEIDERPFPERLHQACRRLVDELGLNEAFARLSSLPCPLPEPLKTAFRNLSAEERTERVLSWVEGDPCPVTLIHAAHLEADSCCGQVTGRPALCELIGTLEAPGLNAFCSLLSAFGAQSAAWPGTAELGDADRMVMCWAHTGRIYAILRSRVEAAGELQDFADGAIGETFVSLFAADLGYRGDVACPQSASSQRLTVYGLRYAVGDGPNDDVLAMLRPVLRPILSTEAGGTTYPAGVILSDESMAGDSLASFLAHPLPSFVDAVTGTTLGEWATGPRRYDVLAQSLDAVSAPSNEMRREWAFPLSMVGFSRISPILLPKLLAAVDAVRPERLEGDQRELMSSILRFSAVQAALTQDSALMETTKSLLRRTASVIVVDGDVENGRGIQALMRASIDVCRDASGEPDMDRFGTLVISLANAVPQGRPAMRSFITRACHQIPFRQAQTLWPTVFELRRR